MNTTIAVLVTCHNRREKTLKCLTHLFSNELWSSDNHKMEVFLVDDGSTDGTGEAVRSKFPEVHVIKGTGNLFWNQGMRLAWNVASMHYNYNYYLWLNDDTFLEKNALENIIDDYKEVLKKENNAVILIGACKESKGSNTFSYGGRNDNGPVIPNGKLQQCKYINGNIVLISRRVFEKIGFLSHEYTHTMGDIDYGLRAKKEGIKCYTTKKFIGTCSSNERIPNWCNPKLPLTKRWKIFHSPLGLHIKEYNIFRKKFWGYKWIYFAVTAYSRLLIPKLFQNVSKWIN